MSADPVLELAGVTVPLPKGGERPFAVEGVDLAVARSEILCLVGESGSGKSVLAHAVMGLLGQAGLGPPAGRIKFDGEDLLLASAARWRQLRGARLAMVFQEPMTSLNPVLSCGRQIDEVLAVHTRRSAPARRDRVLTALREVMIAQPERALLAYPHQLSGGERQRIMIAMALVMEPALLIADEPTTALDVTTQAQILRLIAELRQRHGTSVLFITHDFGVVAEVADRVAVMQAGRIVEAGTRAAVLGRPAHGYTKALLAAVPSLVPRRPCRRRTAPPDLLRTRGLTKTYEAGGWMSGRRQIPAVRGVDLALGRGEILGIVGESGSGKTTVARCVARLIEPSEGEIVLGGTAIARLPPRQLRPWRRRVQMVFQDPYRSLNPRRTVGQSIVEGPLNFGVPRAAAWARARELTRLVQLDPTALDRYPHQFSGGQRQRIAIARALAMEPELLVADEPVSALDVSIQAQVIRLLEDVRERLGLAILFITHDLRVAAQLCDRIAVMYRGEVVEQGPTAQLFASPRHAYTVALLQAAPGRGWQFGSGQGLVPYPEAAQIAGLPSSMGRSGPLA